MTESDKRMLARKARAVAQEAYQTYLLNDSSEQDPEDAANLAVSRAFESFAQKLEREL
jgi:hypothetical protein